MKALRFSKPDRAWIRAWLPLLVLLLGLSSMFVFGNDRGHYYRHGGHDEISSESMAIAANLSPEHNFLMFRQRLERLDSPDEPYNRFPVGLYALLKLAILPLGDDLSAQIWVGRLLMLLFASAAAVFAYLALRRLTGSGWIASAATMATFSSYYVLYYNDMVSTQVTGIFGILLTFHGMVVFEQDGRFRQLLVKTCAAVLLGWHVMALVLPFVVLGLAVTLVRSYSPAPQGGVVSRIRSSVIAALSSRHIRYGAIAGAFCAAVMAFNIANEYLALDRDVPLTRLPTVMSYTARLGVDDQIISEQTSRLAWGPYLREQVSRIGRMSTPYFVEQRRRGRPLSLDIPGLSFAQQETGDAGHLPLQRAALPLLAGLTGVFVMAVSAAGLFFMRHKLLIATLLLAGWCWVIPMRTFAGTHEFETLFHIGTTLVFFTSGLLLVRWLVRREWVIGVLAVAAAGVFVLSSFEMSSVGHGAESARFEEAVMQDFEVIRSLTPGEDVLVLLRGRDPRSQADFAGAHHAVSHYLAQRSKFLRYERDTLTGEGRYTVMRKRLDIPALRTPENREIFLYDSSDLIDMYREVYRSSMSGELIARGDFDVYRKGDSLYFVKEPCEYQDADLSFFLHMVPADEDDLLKHRRQYGFNELHFGLAGVNAQGVKFEDVCMTLVALPEYEIARLETGHILQQGWEVGQAGYEVVRIGTGHIGGGSGVRSHDSSGLIDLYRSAHQRITSGEPVLRSQFDIYAGEGALTYVRESCEPDDADRRFYLHVYPVDAGLLSGLEAEIGYKNRDFSFWEQGGLIFDGKCMVTVTLPEYDVARVDTGQFSESEGIVWGREFSLSGE